MSRELKFKDGKDHIVDLKTAEISAKADGHYSYFRDEKTKVIGFVDNKVFNLDKSKIKNDAFSLSLIPVNCRHSVSVLDSQVNAEKVSTISEFIAKKYPDYKIAETLSEFNTLLNQEVKKTKEETISIEET